MNRIANIAARSRTARITDFVYAGLVAVGLTVMSAAAIPATVAATGPAPVKPACVDAEYIASAEQIAEPDQQYLAACDDKDIL